MVVPIRVRRTPASGAAGLPAMATDASGHGHESVVCGEEG